MHIARIDTNVGPSLIKRKESHEPSSREAVKFMQTLKEGISCLYLFVTLYRYIAR